MRDSVFFAQIPTLVIDLSLDMYTDCTYNILWTNNGPKKTEINYKKHGVNLS